ncbi:sensor histidine kinase KdpD [Massilia sp. Mn16-1_5]|uniref:sensor histidine kinase n=1 Tax=Massilia sp. Mn16-1_5 TaxID=2079199 RepID=UPI001444F083|nr:HAMP domain-containing sensor histidine kinase [Massilia sp. Mn16-1_5]
MSTTAQQFLAVRDKVMTRWEHEIRSRIDGADALRSPVITNTIPAFFDNIAEALSPNYPRKNATSGNNAASAHGGERARMTSFGADQVVHEYQILRESIVVEAAGQVELTVADWAIIDRSINTAIREAIREFTMIQSELQRKLAAALSHDMRTPLGIIANGAELIQALPDLDAAKRAAQKIATSAERLEQMMADLLDALTTNTGEKLALTVSEFDVAELIQEVREAYAQPHGIDIRANVESIKGFWSRNLMRRALENLINNGQAYGDGRGIELMAVEARGRLMLSVHNTGNPIPKEHQMRIFDYLAREQTMSSKVGWGLGLAFVKNVAESHGGSIAVDSSTETGTTFLIDIPVDCRPYVQSSTP